MDKEILESSKGFVKPSTAGEFKGVLLGIVIGVALVLAAQYFGFVPCFG